MFLFLFTSFIDLVLYLLLLLINFIVVLCGKNVPQVLHWEKQIKLNHENTPH